MQIAERITFRCERECTQYYDIIIILCIIYVLSYIRIQTRAGGRYTSADISLRTSLRLIRISEFVKVFL